MLINLRDKNNNLVVKDLLDIDFDMSVEEENKKYYVAVNRKYRLNQEFNDKESAEHEMLYIADTRNDLENELKNF